MPRFLISATHKSSGKTTITLGLCATFMARGLTVQPFKKGPDYIDPLWLSQAAARSCYNLDFYTMSTAEIVANVKHFSQQTDITIIEGNHGLYDGLDIAGSDCTAALAKLLKAPVILILPTTGMTRGIAPLLLGYQAFDKELTIGGVILNQVAGQRHESKLRTAIGYYTDIPVLGILPRNPRLTIVERHLGLIPSNEEGQAQDKITTIAAVMAEYIDVDALLAIARTAGPLPDIKLSKTVATTQRPVTIGILRDAAFGFYYPGDLIALEVAGGRLVFINALNDTHLPNVDALFIGGGFPETQMKTLARNVSLKSEIRQAVEHGLPVYAECGGLMYLARQLTWNGVTCDMVGALPCDTIVEEHPQGRGYVHLRETGHGLWPLRDAAGQLADFHAHEFHYSRVVNLPSHLRYAYQVLRGTGLNGEWDGLVYKNTLASYVHLRDVEANHWTQRFVEFIRRHTFLK